MANRFFCRQLASYASVHRDARNKATHFVGIPVIVFSLLLAASQGQVELGGRTVSAAAVLATLGVLGWMVLDLGIGVVMAAIMVAAWYAAEAMAAALGPVSTWWAFAVLFIGGWVLQFLGHHFEGRRPALLDNIFQAFIGPMFLVAEVLVEAGWRHDLATAVSEGDVSTL
jgi:uncharacterized membrane protein YGL010W